MRRYRGCGTNVNQSWLNRDFVYTPSSMVRFPPRILM